MVQGIVTYVRIYMLERFACFGHARSPATAWAIRCEPNARDDLREYSSETERWNLE